MQNIQKLKAGEFCRGRSCACPYNLNFFQQGQPSGATIGVAPTGIFLEQGIFFRARNKKFFNGVLQNTQINFVGAGLVPALII